MPFYIEFSLKPASFLPPSPVTDDGNLIVFFLVKIVH